MTQPDVLDVPELPESALPLDEVPQAQRPPDALIINALSQELARINDNRIYLLAENAYLRAQLAALQGDGHGHAHPH